MYRLLSKHLRSKRAHKVDDESQTAPTKASTPAKCNSNPPPYNLVDSHFYRLNQERMNSENIYTFTRQYQGRLEVRTDRPIKGESDLHEILGAWLDQYEGPSLTKPLISCIYLFLGLNLKLESDNGFNSYRYSQSINKRLSFMIEGTPFQDSDPPVNWYRTTGFEDSTAKIIFKLTSAKTKRAGTPFKSVIEAGFKLRSVSEFGGLAELYEIPIRNHGDDIIFLI